MTRQVINEASTLTVRARFYGANNTAQAPVTVRYMVRDVSNDRTVVEWTNVSPGTYVDIQINAEDNAIYQDSLSNFKRFEERMLVVQTDFDTDDQHTEEFRYLVRNLKGLDS